ncbi:VOC family protein, partial [Piscibacillus halophilus]
MSFHKLPTKHIDQLSLNVSNLDQSITFYREMLGMKLLEQSER